LVDHATFLMADYSRPSPAPAPKTAPETRSTGANAQRFTHPNKPLWRSRAAPPSV